MSLRISPALLERFPTTHLGVLIVDGINNQGSNEHITSFLQQQIEHVRASFTLETLLADSRIQCWRNAYQSFGAKPRDYRSSIEALCRRVLNGKDLPSISPLVDLYNAISLKYLLPAGGEDLDAAQGDIELTFASDQESPVKLLGDQEPQPPFAGEVIYKDSLSAICRCWNWREAERTKLTHDTKRCILVLEDVQEERAGFKSGLDELESLVQKYCGGTIKRTVLDKNNPECIY